MARSLPSWREPERVLELAALAVAEREGGARATTIARAAGAGCRGAARARRLLRHAARSTSPPRWCAAASPPGRADPLPRARRRRATTSPRRASTGAAVARVSAMTRAAGAELAARDRRLRGRQEGDRHRRARPARRRSATPTTSSICSGNTDRQTKAIHDGIHQGHEEGARHPAAARRGRSPRRAGS